MNYVAFFWRVLTLTTLSKVCFADKAVADLTGLPCRYDIGREGLEADCSKRRLTEIPGDLTDEINVLDLKDNQLTRLNNTSFQGVPRLVYLNIQSNHIRNIEPGVFHSLPDLKTIVLGNNNFTHLPRYIFSRNRKLQVVDLSNNRLGSLPINALNTVATLQQVDLRHNLITRLNFTGFRSRQISALALTSNRLSTIYEEDFFPLRYVHIDDLSFSANELTFLKDGVFQHLAGVRKLRLNSNHIRNFSINPFIGMDSLEELYLIKNGISTIIPLLTSYNRTPALPRLSFLDLQDNKIFSIPSRAFWGLSKVVRLYMPQSRIKNLQNDSFEGLDSLEVLDLTGNLISYVTADMFSVCPCLRTLVLRSNKFTTFNIDQFGGILSLTSLNLAGCQIRDIRQKLGLWNTPLLESLDLSNNKLDSILQYSFYGMPNLTTLNISGNQITEIGNHAFASNDNLQELKVSSLQIKIFAPFLVTPFSNLNHLKTLSLSDTPVALTYELFIGLWNIRKLFLSRSGLRASSFWDLRAGVPVLSNLSTLERLYLKGNRLTRLLPGTFQGLHKLLDLQLQSCEIVYLDQSIFKNLTSLRYLNLDQNHIKTLTTWHLSDLGSLVMMSIVNNEITDLDVHLFSKSPNLSVLYISHNHLTTFKENTILPTRILDVSNNPFACNCGLKWFLNWLKVEEVSINHPEQTNCSIASFASLRNKPILSVDPKSLCGPSSLVIVSISLVIVTSAIVCLLAYQRRWWINYQCFHLKLFLVRSQKIPDERERLDYEYDINLVFDEGDEEWVRATLNPGLGERLPDFDRIVCGDDDLPLGMFYIDAITEVVEHSYKTILTVSNRAVDSHAFIDKLRLAVDHMNEVELEKVILIFKEDIPDGRLPYLVRLFLSKNKPYFLWSEDEYGQRLMWEKLVRELGHNRKMNDVLPI